MSNSQLEQLFKDVESKISNDEILFKELGEGLNSKTYSLLQIVEQLGVLLTHKETSFRLKGTQILSKCLSMLPKNHLTSRELDFLVTFYTERLKDHHSVIPEVLQGLYHLCDMQHLSQDSYTILFSSIFVHFHCQSQLILDRKLFYDILLKCMNHNMKDLNSMGADFISGVIQSIRGERDPRNLLFLFSTFIPEFLNKFELGDLSEEMFDTMSCYFPLDFSPKSTEPDAVTRDDLAVALEPNLLAKQEFAQFCIPLALEKLESDLKVAKLDSLCLLIGACYQFSVQTLDANFFSIWTKLKLDLNHPDVQVKNKVVELLHAMLTRLSDKNSKELFLLVFSLLQFTFSDIDPTLFLSNTNLLVSISKDSSVCMKELAVLLVPLLFITIKKTCSKHFIHILNQIFEICVVNFQINLLVDSEVSIDWNELFDFYVTQSMLNPSCLNLFKTFCTYFNDNQRMCVYNVLKQMIESNVLCKEYEECIQTYGKHYQNEVHEHIVVFIQEQIQNRRTENGVDIKQSILNDLKENDASVYTKDEDMEVDAPNKTNTESTKNERTMKPLAYRKDENNVEIPIYIAICPPASPHRTLEEIYVKNVYCPLICLNHFLANLSSEVLDFCLNQSSHSTSSTHKFLSNSTNKSVLLKLHCLKYVLQKYETCPHILNYFENEFNIVEKCIDIYLNRHIETTTNDECFENDVLAILNVLLRHLKQYKYDRVVQLLEKVLCLLSKTCEKDQHLNEKSNTKCATYFDNDCHKNVLLLIPFLCNVDLNTIDNVQMIKHVKQLFDSVLNISVSTNNSSVNKYTSLLVSLILNNLQDLETNKYEINIENVESKLRYVEYNKKSVFVLHAYVMKSLLLKGHKNVDYWLNILIEDLKNVNGAKLVFYVFEILIREESITNDSFEFVNVKFLYRQRLFLICYDRILKNIAAINQRRSMSNPQSNDQEINCHQNENKQSSSNDEEEQSIKLYNLLTILIQLERLPKQIVFSNLKSMLPIMIDCLQCVCASYEISLKSSENDTSSDFSTTNLSNLNGQFRACAQGWDAINVDRILAVLLRLFVDLLKAKTNFFDDYVNSLVDKFLHVSSYHRSLSHRILGLECLYYLSFLNPIHLLPYRQKVIDKLKMCLDDVKRLVRKQAVQTIDRWYILGAMEDEEEE